MTLLWFAWICLCTLLKQKALQIVRCMNDNNYSKSHYIICRQIVNTLNVNMSGKRRKNEMIFYSLISAFQRIFQYLKRNIHNSKRKLWHSHPQPLLIKNDTQIVKAHAKWANNTHYKYTLIFHRGGLYYKILCTTKVRR